MILTIIVVAVILFLSVIKDWLHYLEKTTYKVVEREHLKKMWHRLGAAIHALTFALIAYLVYGFELKAVALFMLLVAIRHIVFDQGWNLIEGKPFLYRGKNQLESLAGDWAYMGFKLVHLAFTVFWLIRFDHMTWEAPAAFYVCAAGITLAYLFRNKKISK